MSTSSISLAEDVQNNNPHWSGRNFRQRSDSSLQGRASMYLIKQELPDKPLDFGSDLHLRMKFFLPASFAHPAKLHLGFLQWLVERYTRPDETIADPMAGIGSSLLAVAYGRNVIAREIEPRWLEILRANATYIQEQAGLFVGSMDIGQADAREPWGYTADHVLFSPPYGNEASSSPNARRTLPYRLHNAPFTYGERWQRFAESPTEGSKGAVVFHYGTHPAQIGHWRGGRYWTAMQQIYTQAHIALRGHGCLIVVVKDHIYDRQRVPTAEQTITLCESLGFALHAHHQRQVSPLSLWQRRRKERGEPVVEEEDGLIFQKRQGNRGNSMTTSATTGLQARRQERQTGLPTGKLGDALSGLPCPSAMRVIVASKIHSMRANRKEETHECTRASYRERTV